MQQPKEPKLFFNKLCISLSCYAFLRNNNKNQCCHMVGFPLIIAQDSHICILTGPFGPLALYIYNIYNYYRCTEPN